MLKKTKTKQNKSKLRKSKDNNTQEEKKQNMKEKTKTEKKVISQIYLFKYPIVFKIYALWDLELQHIFQQ